MTAANNVHFSEPHRQPKFQVCANQAYSSSSSGRARGKDPEFERQHLHMKVRNLPPRTCESRYTALPSLNREKRGVFLPCDAGCASHHGLEPGMRVITHYPAKPFHRTSRACVVDIVQAFSGDGVFEARPPCLRPGKRTAKNALEIRRCASNCIQLDRPLRNAATARRGRVRRWEGNARSPRHPTDSLRPRRTPAV